MHKIAKPLNRCCNKRVVSKDEWVQAIRIQIDTGNAGMVTIAINADACIGIYASLPGGLSNVRDHRFLVQHVSWDKKSTDDNPIVTNEKKFRFNRTEDYRDNAILLNQWTHPTIQKQFHNLHTSNHTANDLNILHYQSMHTSLHSCGQKYPVNRKK